MSIIEQSVGKRAEDYGLETFVTYTRTRIVDIRAESRVCNRKMGWSPESPLARVVLCSAQADGDLSPKMANHSHHNALDMEGIGLPHQNRLQGVIGRMQLNCATLAVIGLDCGISIHQSNDGLPVLGRATNGHIQARRLSRPRGGLGKERVQMFRVSHI